MHPAETALDVVLEIPMRSSLHLSLFLGLALLMMGQTTLAGVTIEQAMGELAAQTESQLPIRAGKYSTLTSVFHSGRIITHSYTIDFDKETIRQAKLQDELPKRSAYNLCNQKHTAILLKHGGIFHYLFYDNEGLYVFEMEITKSDC